MKTKSLLMASAFATAAACASTADADPLKKYTLQEMIEMKSTDEVRKFVFDDKNILKVLEAGFKPSIFDDRNEVSAYSDPLFLECTQNSPLSGGAKLLIEGVVEAGAEAGINALTKNPTIAKIASRVLPIHKLGEFVSDSDLKTFGDCVDDWSTRVSDFVATERVDVSAVHVAQLTEETAKLVVKMLQSEAEQNGVKIYAAGKAEPLDVQLKTLEPSLKASSERTAKALEDLVKEIKDSNLAAQDAIRSAREKQALREELQAKRDTVAASAAVVGFLGKIVFRNDPVAAARIQAGSNAAAQIADSIVQLGGPDKIGDAKKVLLSANIATGAMALISLIGSKNSESAVLMRQMKAIQGQISGLRQEMHGRFDRLEDMMIEVAKHFDGRLNTIESRMDRMQESLELLAEDNDNIYRINRESFRYLVSSDFKSSVRRCARPISRSEFPADELTRCFENVINYGTDVASLQVVSSGALYNHRIHVDDALAITENISPINRLGYLDAALRYAKKDNMNPAFNLPVSVIASPPDWADAVDILSEYFANADQFRSLAAAGYDRAKLLEQFGSDLALLSEQGEKAKEYVTAIRKAGVPFALDRYKAQSEALLDAVAKETLLEMNRMDIGILEARRKLSAALRGNIDVPFATNGDMRYSIKYFDSYIYYVTQGPEAGKETKIVQKESSYFHQMGELMQGGQEHHVHQNEINKINQPDYYKTVPFSLDFETKFEDHLDAIGEYNTPYLNAVAVKDFTNTGKGALYKAFVKARQSASVQEACQKVSQARKTVGYYADLLRTSFQEADDSWRTAIADLPGESAVALCGRLAVSQKEIAETLLTNEYVKAGEREKFDAAIEKARTSFANSDQSVGIDAIDIRLQALESLRADAAITLQPQ